MRHLHLILSLPQDADPDGLERLPGLGSLLRRGRPLPVPEGTSVACCQALGIDRQGDWPVAPFTARAVGLDVKEGYWLRLDPVHLEVGMHGVFLRGGLALEEEETRALRALVAPILASAGHELLAGGDGVLYLRCGTPPRLDTTPLDQVEGRQPMPFLPRGSDAPAWVRLLHEVQMALHEHPFNLARTAAGRLPINSLWPWGGGRLARPGRPPGAAWGDLPLLRQLATGLDMAPAHPPAGLAQALATPGEEGLVVLAGDRHPAACAEAPQAWDEAWFRPLQSALRRFRLASARVDLLGPGAASRRLAPLDAWRIWR